MTTIFFVLILLLLIASAFIIMQIRKGRTHTSEIDHLIREELKQIRDESSETAKALREEVGISQKASTDTLVKIIGQMGLSQNDHLERVEKHIREMASTNEERMEKIKSAVDTQLTQLYLANEKKLDQIRHTVDEKLQETLEKRLGASFDLVGRRLESVQQGLGEMKDLARGVGDLKRLLTNVKSRGTWAEVQLGTLLEHILTPDQYEKNVQIKPSAGETVEFAIRLPGSERDGSSRVWLPIDAKFPQEDYLRLLEASEQADNEGVKKATAGLIRAVQNSAKIIYEKYIYPPATTDFAVMFVPTEGLYAEILRQPGQVEEMQQKYRVVVAGPTTLAAILNSLRVGFQTLALEKRSHEVWTVLSSVKIEFEKFGTVLTKIKKQLNTVSSTIDQTEVRTKAMARKLKDVETLPENKRKNDQEDEK